MLIKSLTTFLVLAMLAGCSSSPSSTSVGDHELGKASFYADKYHGRLTANGETYSQQGMTAAHKTLPFGSQVKVTNLANNRSVMVRVNDRGPFVRGRVIDLTKQAFTKLASTNQGVIDVRVELIKK